MPSHSLCNDHNKNPNNGKNKNADKNTEEDQLSHTGWKSKLQDGRSLKI